MRNRLAIIVAAVASLLTSAALHAGPFSALYVFGDSLSDNGNIPQLFWRPAPYAPGRFSNGPIAVEYLANNLGIAPTDFHDFAVGGATTGLFNSEVPIGPLHSTGTLSQIQTYVAGGVADPNALYVVWAGPNDFFDLTNPAQGPAAVAQAVSNLVTAAALLHLIGAEHILIPDMADLGKLPAEDANASFATLLSTAFNNALKVSLPNYVTSFDTFSLLDAAVMNPAAYGFSNVSDACVEVLACALGTVAQQNQYLFFDGVHPTTAGHQILANGFTAAVVPEPASIALFLIGLMAFAVRRSMSAAH